MTQEKLADLTNCSREYIAYLENGVKTPSLPILVDLANALHISVDALLVDSLDYSLSCLRTSLFCFLLYQLSLWWVKYRAQPEAISTQNHAGRNAP